MWILLGTTLTASFFDSLNPSAITQQMLLQAMVKRKRMIWFFIGGIGAVMIVGVLLLAAGIRLIVKTRRGIAGKGAGLEGETTVQTPAQLSHYEQGIYVPVLGKTRSSILISCGARLAPFDLL